MQEGEESFPLIGQNLVGMDSAIIDPSDRIRQMMNTESTTSETVVSPSSEKGEKFVRSFVDGDFDFVRVLRKFLFFNYYFSLKMQ